MKKTLLSTIVALLAVPAMTVSAQDYSAAEVDSLRNEVRAMREQLDKTEQADKSKKIFGRQKSFHIGMAFNDWKPEDLPKFSANYGFTLGLNKTYFVHKNPIGGFLKFGIDATWFDITYINYKANPIWEGTGDEAGDYGYGYDNDYGYDYDYDYDYDDELEDPNLGSHQIDVAMGVGVSATFAPFYASDNGLRYLKGKVFCRFMPTFSMMLISEPDDTRFNSAFVPYVTFGAEISWKAIGLFVEGRWGSANYHISGVDDDYDYDYDYDDGFDDIFNFDKISCNNYGVRFGICFNF